MTVDFQPSHSVIASQSDLDAWLDRQRQAIGKLLAEGKRVAV